MARSAGAGASFLKGYPLHRFTWNLTFRVRLDRFAFEGAWSRTSGSGGSLGPEQEGHRPCATQRCTFSPPALFERTFADISPKIHGMVIPEFLSTCKKGVAMSVLACCLGLGSVCRSWPGPLPHLQCRVPRGVFCLLGARGRRVRRRDLLGLNGLSLRCFFSWVFTSGTP